MPSSAQLQQQSSSAGLRLVLLSVLDHPPNHPPPPPGDSSFTWSGARVYHWTFNESCSTTLWHLFDIIYSYPRPNLNYSSIIYKNLSNDNLIQSLSQWWISTKWWIFMKMVNFHHDYRISSWWWSLITIKNFCNNYDFWSKCWISITVLNYNISQS